MDSLSLGLDCRSVAPSAGRLPRLALRSEGDGEGAKRAPDRIAGQLVPASGLIRSEDGEDAPHRRLAGVFEGLSRLHLADLAEEGLVLDRADPLALRGREAERLDDLRLPKGGRPLRLEGDLAEPDALRGRQDRVDLRLVGAGLLQADPDAAR